jgi:hypothetical protein
MAARKAWNNNPRGTATHVALLRHVDGGLLKYPIKCVLPKRSSDNPERLQSLFIIIKVCKYIMRCVRLFGSHPGINPGSR